MTDTLGDGLNQSNLVNCVKSVMLTAMIIIKAVQNHVRHCVRGLKIQCSHLRSICPSAVCQTTCRQTASATGIDGPLSVEIFVLSRA